jgi:hypothetical protein
MAQSDVLLRLAALVAIGGIADIDGRVASAKSVAIDLACVKTQKIEKPRE